MTKSHPGQINYFRHGSIISCILLTLLLCACSKPAIRTETVEVKTPVYVALPAGLVEPCLVAPPSTWTNGALVEYAIGLKTCLSASNDKLARIRKLQP